MAETDHILKAKKIMPQKLSIINAGISCSQDLNIIFLG
jgi:hypothetical protein